MSYESPINIQEIASQIQEKVNADLEYSIMMQVRQVVNVDKDELIKALQYDRNQYEKGMQDAKKVLMPKCKYRGKCMSHPDISREYYDYCDLYREDCNCQCIWRQGSDYDN